VAFRGVDSEGWRHVDLEVHDLSEKGHDSYISNTHFKEFAAWKSDSE
jgi:hypothetical protein